jgi:hypothetical protein
MYRRAMTGGHDRGEASGLRGRLSEVYFPALVTAQAPALALRLGDRATVDDPLFGRSSGMSKLEPRLAEIADWLSARDATFDNFGFVTGSDRDVTEGTLTLTTSRGRVRVPVAVVAERRREREVALRAYYATRGLRDLHSPRPELLPPDDQTAVPPPVAAHLDALSRGDVAAVVASFENGAIVRSADGRTHAKLDPEGGPLTTYYEQLLVGGGPAGSIQTLKNARADDGRTCALEYTVVRFRGHDVAPQPGLAVYERGESGLLRSLRVYDDFGP